jgi:hypothetical protein
MSLGEHYSYLTYCEYVASANEMTNITNTDYFIKTRDLTFSLRSLKVMDKTLVYVVAQIRYVTRREDLFTVVYAKYK